MIQLSLDSIVFLLDLLLCRMGLPHASKQSAVDRSSLGRVTRTQISHREDGVWSTDHGVYQILPLTFTMLLI